MTKAQSTTPLTPSLPGSDTLISRYTEALERALARVIADAQKDILQVRTEAQLVIAELRAQNADLQNQIREMVSARLAQVKDGTPGRDGTDGIDGKDGKDGAPGRDGIDGKDGAPGRDGLPGRDGVDGVDGQPGKAGAPGKDGVDGTPGRDGLPGRDGVDGVDGKRGLPGEPGRPGKDGSDGTPGKDGLPGKDGAPGQPGKDGAPGKLPKVKAWAPGVHYEGDVATFKGSLYQATKDTAQEPDVGDWVLLARAGVDGRTPQIRGTFEPGTLYSALDVVACNGGSFVAKHDDPGVCPGPGWQLLAGQGKRGEKGLPGDRGLPGKDGETLHLAGWEIDADNFRAVPVFADGTKGEAIQLRRFFERYRDEVND